MTDKVMKEISKRYGVLFNNVMAGFIEGLVQAGRGMIGIMWRKGW